jgi:hypothetical protein
MKQMEDTIREIKPYGPILFLGVLFYSIFLIQIYPHFFTPLEEVAVLIEGSVLVVVGFLVYRERFLADRERLFKELNYLRAKEEQASKGVTKDSQGARDRGVPQRLRDTLSDFRQKCNAPGRSSTIGASFHHALHPS